MHKKLQKYIESQNEIKDCKLYELIPNGGMIFLINHKSTCEVVIEELSFRLEKFQAILLNAYENSVYIKSDENINLSCVRFKGAGASFFYEEYLDELMHNAKKPINEY